MAEFAYNNVKNANTGHTPFELNCDYHPRMSYEEDVNPCSQSKWADELLAEFRKLIIVCQENLYYAQELQNWAHNKGVKPWNYAVGKKVWLNSKYIKTKRNRNLEAKLFGPFRVLYPFEKQEYKLELPQKWRIHDIFHVSLLEQDTTKKERLDEKNAAELDTGNKSGKAIWNSAVYAKKSKSSHLPGFYYLVSWKKYPKEENTWESASAIQYFRKIISLFHKDHLDKPRAIFPAIDTVPLMARPAIKPSELPKQKRGQPAKKHVAKAHQVRWQGRYLSQFAFIEPELVGSRRSVSLTGC